MSKCRSCTQPILWAVTENGRRMPLDPEPTDDGTIVLVDSEPPGRKLAIVLGPLEVEALGADRNRYVSHFATCLFADAHRNRQ